MAGALSATELEAAVTSAGFDQFEITWQKNIFAGSKLGGPAERLGTVGINFCARRPVS